MAPKALLSAVRGRTMDDAYPRFIACSRQGAKLGSVSIFLHMLTLPVRMAVPVGPRPRSVSAQVIRNVPKYPSSKPAWATARTVLPSSSSANPIHTILWPQSSQTILHTSCRYSASSLARIIALLLLLSAVSVRFSLRSSSSLFLRLVISRKVVTTDCTWLVRGSRIGSALTRSHLYCSRDGLKTPLPVP